MDANEGTRKTGRPHVRWMSEISGGTIEESRGATRDRRRYLILDVIETCADRRGRRVTNDAISTPEGLPIKRRLLYVVSRKSEEFFFNMLKICTE